MAHTPYERINFKYTSAKELALAILNDQELYVCRNTNYQRLVFKNQAHSSEFSHCLKSIIDYNEPIYKKKKPLTLPEQLNLQPVICVVGDTIDALRSRPDLELAFIKRYNKDNSYPYQNDDYWFKHARPATKEEIEKYIFKEYEHDK